MAKNDAQNDVLRLEGRLDIHTVKVAHEALLKRKTTPKGVDAKNLESIDTAGVQWLWWISTKNGGNLTVTNASTPFKNLLKAAGLERWVAQ